MNVKEENLNFIFHSTEKYKNYLLNLLNKQNIYNVEVISNEDIKSEVLKKSIGVI